jgi:outer membrane protein OmpA-like peptidoglycan-associated protein
MNSARIRRKRNSAESPSSIHSEKPSPGSLTPAMQKELIRDREPALRLGPPSIASHTALAPVMQRKMEVSQPGDEHEEEAERVANQVMRMPDADAPSQQQCACGGKCTECLSRRQTLQRQPSTQTFASVAPDDVQRVLNTAGQPLDVTTRDFMEPRLGHDLSHVRVHSGEDAALSALSVNALAYTVGHDIVFAKGLYEPHTQAGRQLLAHELAHVVQQTGQASASGQQTTGQGEATERDSGSDDRQERAIPNGGKADLAPAMKRVAAPLIQRDPPDQLFSGVIRMNENGRIEIIAGTPSLPVLGSLGVGMRCENGRCQPVGGQDPLDASHRTYSVQEALDLLRGRAGSNAPGGRPGPTGGPTGGPTTPGRPSVGLPIPENPPNALCLAWDLGGHCLRSVPLPPPTTPGGQPAPTLDTSSLSIPPRFPPPALGPSLRLTLAQSTIIDHFANDVAAVPAAANEQLESLASTLRAFPEGDVYIEGHTDSSAGEEYNQRLSEQRAQSVRSALVQRGVAASRLHIEGFGKRRLRFPNEGTDEERALNRRVEVRYRLPFEAGMSRLRLALPLRIGP